MINLKLKSLIGDISAGAIIATSNIALAVSFAAAIFQGDLAEGFSTGVWIMLMTMIVVGLIVGMLTTLSPIAAGPDTAVIAVIGLMAPAIAGPMLADGTSFPTILFHVMLGITLAALTSGLTLLALGMTGWAQSLRFVPYPLVAGFLAATGILLISFSVKIVTGDAFEFSKISTLWSGDSGQKIGMMLAFTLLLGGARNTFRSPVVTPLIFFGFALALNALLQTGYVGNPDSWYLWTGNGLEAWLPIHEFQASPINWSRYLVALPELMTCVIVSLISLIVRISTFESSRMAAADINHEFRLYGTASILSGLTGGMTGGILFSTSKFLADSSAQTRFVYVVIAALLALMIFADLDLARLVPVPILGGFLLLLGYSMTVEALKVTLRQRARLEMLMTIGIMTLCLWQGFIVGVAAGFVAACLLFAFSYARIGVVRRHTTRRLLASATERAHEIEAIIRENGDSIHLYELEGYIFFGSSEAVFEQIKRRRRSQTGTPIRCLILDLSRVTGYDSSAVNTLNKLRGYSRKYQIQLIICGISIAGFQKLFRNSTPGGSSGVHLFVDLINALDWAEDALLLSLQHDESANHAPNEMAPWLSAEFGTPVSAAVVDGYFERNEIPVGARLYSQDEAADTIDFVVSGTVAIVLELGSGKQQCVRRSSRQTVIGEMGFFRGAERTASVIVEKQATIYSLSRANYERLRKDHPSIHYGLLNFIIKTLSDRLNMATVELSEMRYVDTRSISSV